MRPAVGTGSTLNRLAASTWPAIEWARRDVALRYRQTYLGWLWVVVQPVALLIVYGLVVVRVLDAARGGWSYLLFASAGLALWTFVSNALSRSAMSIIAAQAVLNRVYFPREVIPLATVLATLPDLLLTVTLVILLQVIVGDGLHLTLVVLPIVTLGLMAVVAAASVLLAVLGAFFRDLGQVMPLALQLLLFASPVVYAPERVPSSLRWALDANPLAASLEAFRSAVLLGRWPSAWSLVFPLVVGLLMLLVSLRYVRAVEHRFPDAL